jgi:hypothetical protein
MIDLEFKIELWNVHFDDDNFSYTTLSKSKAIQSIHTFADLQISANMVNKKTIISDIIEQIDDQIENNASDETIRVTIGDAKIQLKRITLDYQHPITRALAASCEQVDKETQDLIDSILSTSSL